jgi:hypothetical protein
VASFFAWWVLASWRALADPRTPGPGLALAGSTVIGLLLAHSLVDYPLRTPAMAVLFALACGLLVPGPGGAANTSPVRRG